MKRVLPFIPMILIAYIGWWAGCGSMTKMYSESSTSISADVNEQFGIVLDTNPTTGYSWQESNDPVMLELVHREYRKGEHAKSIGGGGVEYFTFKALKAGETTIIMTYARPWEKETVRQVVFSVDIH